MEGWRDRRAGRGVDRSDNEAIEQGVTQIRKHRGSYFSLACLSISVSLAGTLDSCRAVYEKAMDLRVCTPSMIVNYAQLLWEHKFFEDCFRIFERGVSVSQRGRTEGKKRRKKSAAIENEGQQHKERDE